MTSYLPGTSARAFDELQDLSPWSVEQFLELNEWTREEFNPGTFAVWSSPDQRASVLLPYDRDLRDFERRYRETLEVLSATTGLAGEALALEVLSARKDVFLLRADQTTLDGSIPFLEARRLIEGVDTMLKSAAASTINPRASTAGRKPSLVTSFMQDDVRMGHTLHGSFVITVLAADAADEARRYRAWQRANAATVPDPRPVDQNPQDDDPTSFPRQVMSTLAVGLATARTLLEPSGPHVSLDEAVASGVTLQLLESVKAMSSSEGVRGLDMAFRWARLEPLEVGVPTRIELPREATEAAAPDVIKRFSKVPEVEHDQILGKVVRLERAEGAEDGQVIVDGSVGKQRRRVKVPLSGEAYRLAIAAHDTSDAVVVEGNFARKSRGWRMQEGATIRVVDLGEPAQGEGEERH